MSAPFQKTNCGKAHIKYISTRRLFWIWYLLAAFSPVSSFSQCVTIVSVVVITAILLLAEFFGSKGLAAVIYAEDIKVPHSELKKEGVDTTMSPEDIDEVMHGKD